MESRGPSARSAWRPRGANFSTVGPRASEWVGPPERVCVCVGEDGPMDGGVGGRSDGEEGVGGVVRPP